MTPKPQFVQAYSIAAGILSLSKVCELLSMQQLDGGAT